MTALAVQQLAFDLHIEQVHALDQLDTWLALSGSKEREREAYGWMVRKYHATALEALKEAHEVSRIIGRVYVVEHAVDAASLIYWPHPTNWGLSSEPPFYGEAGAFYHGKRNYYIVQSGTELFEPGETPAEIALKQTEVTERWNSQMAAKP